jgi:hypothetical protein
MHATTELVPARAAVRRHLVSGESELAGDPVAVEALATRVGAFSALRRIGRAAKGAVMLSTAPVRALGSAGIYSLKATGNVAKGIENAAALTEYATRPLAWRPHRKRGGPPAAAAPRADEAAPAASADEEPTAPAEEEPMTDETSGSPRPQHRHVMGALSLLHRARHSPKSARHVQNIAKAAAAGHPGAVLAQAAIAEARKQQRQQALQAPPSPPMPTRVHSAAFPSWGRGAA